MMPSWHGCYRGSTDEQIDRASTAQKDILQLHLTEFC